MQVSFLSCVEMSCTQIASSQVPVSLRLQAGLSFHYKIVGLTDTEMFSSGQSPLFPESSQLTCLPAAWAPQHLSPTALPVHFLKHKRDCVAPGLRSFMAFLCPPQKVQIPSGTRKAPDFTLFTSQVEPATSIHTPRLARLSPPGAHLGPGLWCPHCYNTLPHPPLPVLFLLILCPSPTSSLGYCPLHSPLENSTCDTSIM